MSGKHYHSYMLYEVTYDRTKRKEHVRILIADGKLFYYEYTNYANCHVTIESVKATHILGT